MLSDDDPSTLAASVQGIPRPRRGWVAAVAAALVLGIGAGWAVGYLLRPPTEALGQLDHVMVEVTEGHIGSSLSLNTVARWTATSTWENQASGVVTATPLRGATRVAQGDTLYTVDLRPVVAAQGAVPAFRAIGAGAKGGDVAQLQQMLHHLGHFSGRADGQASQRTIDAIRAWQRAQGVEVTGTVALGDVIFLPTLPSTVTFDAIAASVGRRLSGVEALIAVVQDAPAFALPVTPAQAAMVREGTTVEVAAPAGGTWQATTGAPVASDAPDVVNIPLVGVGGQPVCGDACSTVSAGADVRLPSRVITIPQRTGLVVPSAALVSGGDGSPAVVDAEGAAHPVRVLASAQGRSLIEGVAAGMRVRVQQQ